MLRLFDQIFIKLNYVVYYLRIHILGNSMRAKCHPDSRAIFYEEKTYSKRKVLDFILLLNGFTSILKLVDLFSDVDAELLKKLTQFAPEGRFPDYRDTLKFFKVNFSYNICFLYFN